MGFRDFGGSGIVHMFSGTCACKFFYRICLQFFFAFVNDFVNSFLVVASNIIGARTGRFSNSRKNGESSANDHGQHIPGHSLPVRNFILTNLTAD